MRQFDRPVHQTRLNSVSLRILCCRTIPSSPFSSPIGSTLRYPFPSRCAETFHILGPSAKLAGAGHPRVPSLQKEASYGDGFTPHRLRRWIWSKLSSPAFYQLPGVLAVSHRIGVSPPSIDLRRMPEGSVRWKRPTLECLAWNMPGESCGEDSLLLCLGARSHNTSPSLEAIRRWIRNRANRELGRMLPTFAALTIDSDELVCVSDALGFRHIYLYQCEEWVALSTSARALTRYVDTKQLDLNGVAVQSLLGWQLGDRTLYRGISKLPAGAMVRLSSGTASLTSVSEFVPPGIVSVHEAVDSASLLLTEYMESYLDDNPDATLQLTGGQDSRILLSAIPVSRRRSLRVITLRSADSDDVRIASRLASRYGMIHSVGNLDKLADMPDNEAYERCIAAASRVECMADPIAFACVSLGEEQFDQGPRLSGLGGEVARGFYYMGNPRPAEITMKRVERLAAWRMFANEAADANSLAPEFDRWARDFTIREIFDILVASAGEWHAAIDLLYLQQRLQRWAGIVDTAVCWDRRISDPMLDDRFVGIAHSLPPAVKYNARFLGLLQVKLDEELANVPLDGRPPPRVYAYPTGLSGARIHATSTSKLVRKTSQRLLRARRAPAGGTVLARKVIRHLRRNPESLAGISDLGIFAPDFLDRMLDGTTSPSPGTVSLVVNLVVALSS